MNGGLRVADKKNDNTKSDPFLYSSECIRRNRIGS